VSEVRKNSLEEQVHENTWNIKILQSRYESEQRGRVETGKRVDQSLGDIERLKKSQDEHQKMLMNSGQGLMFRVRELEFWRNAAKDNLTKWMAVAGLILGLGSMIIQVLQMVKK